MSDGDTGGQGKLAARHRRSAPPLGPNSEVGPASAPANGPRPDRLATTTCTRTRIRSSVRQGRDSVCWPATRSTSSAQTVVGNPPGQTPTKTGDRSSKAQRLMARPHAHAERTAPGQRQPWSRFRVGLLALVLVLIAVYFAFTKHIPFTHGYRVHAVFQSSNNLRPGSPVRIAGVNVGKVVDVGRYRHTNLSDVTMEIYDAGLPIHKDATLKIRPRIFLEGNFFVDLKPGSPSAPTVAEGGTIGVDADRDARAARRAVHCAAVGLARRPPAPARRVRQGAQLEADCRSRTRRCRRRSRA